MQPPACPHLTGLAAPLPRGCSRYVSPTVSATAAVGGLCVSGGKKTLWVIIIGPSAPRTRRPSCSVLESGAVASRRGIRKCSERSSLSSITTDSNILAFLGDEPTQGALRVDALAWSCCATPPFSSPLLFSLDLNNSARKAANAAGRLHDGRESPPEPPAHHTTPRHTTCPTLRRT